MHHWQIRGRVLTIDRPLVMGIVNVTPDSFSDGGRHADPRSAVAHGLELVSLGADLLDIGGESTRPGAEPVSEKAELDRILPVLEELAANVAVPISVDTSKATVARIALDSGAAIINDVTALGDRSMAEVVQKAGAGVILMHMQGTPQTMQSDPRYGDVVGEINEFFEQRRRFAQERGINAEQVVLDPGIGFGKTRDHNIEILARLAELQRHGRPICLGVSRKGFLGRLLGERPIERRVAASLAAACYAMSKHAVQIIRVHDVQETKDAVTVFETLAGASQSSI
jgi:dihydropteroate synthase